VDQSNLLTGSNISTGSLKVTIGSDVIYVELDFTVSANVPTYYKYRHKEGPICVVKVMCNGIVFVSMDMHAKVSFQVVQAR
jgi:hypothetical protein